MKRIFILILSLLAFVTVQAQQDNHNLPAKEDRKGVVSTGKTSDGCDDVQFVRRTGKHWNLPSLERTGKRLTFSIVVLEEPRQCGITDEEALVEITIEWGGHYHPRIIERGLYYMTGAQQIRYGNPFDCDTIFSPIIDPTISDCGTGTFQMLIDSLEPGTSYWCWVYAKTADGQMHHSGAVFLTKQHTKCGGLVHRPDNEVVEPGSQDSIVKVKDHEGNEYRVVQIGNQCWTKENMRCSTSPLTRVVHADIAKMNNGVPNYVTSSVDAYYYSYEALNISHRQRGNLYNWCAATDTFGVVADMPPGKRRGICPEGWHLPNTYEWLELVKTTMQGNRQIDTITYDYYIGRNIGTWIGDSVVKMCFGCQWPTEDSTGRPYPNSYPGGYMSTPEKRNSSGFSAMPTSNVQDTGSLGWNLSVSNYWLSNPSLRNIKWAYAWLIDEDRNGVACRDRDRPKTRGFSVRCLRDQLTIAVSPNTGKFCVPETVTYTAKVANEKGDFSYVWRVKWNGIEDSVCTTCMKEFVYHHDSVGHYTIICEATRLATDTLPALNWSDSVFVEGTEDCSIILVDPASQVCCPGDTVKFSVRKYAEDFEMSFTDIHWSVDDEPVAANEEMEFSYRFDQAGTYIVKFEAAGGIEDRVRIKVGEKPQMKVCRDCSNEGFIIVKTSQNLLSGTAHARWCIDHSDTVVSYYRFEKQFVAADTGKVYYVAMLSSEGCHDTLPGLRIATRPVAGCRGSYFDVSDWEKGEEHIGGDEDDNRIDSVRDHEYNWYPVVQFGDRCWMKTNLRVTTSPTTGSSIVIYPDNSNIAISSYSSKVAQWYLNDPIANYKYGLLYNWCAATDTFRPGPGYGIEVAEGHAAANTDKWACSFPNPKQRRGLCPEGWHLPTRDEWLALEKVVNNGNDLPSRAWRGTHAGKLSGGCDWYTSNRSKSPGDYHDEDWGTSSFMALPAGETIGTGAPNQNFSGIGSIARFWSATEFTGADNADAYQLQLHKDSASVNASNFKKSRCMSVRCVRDEEHVVVISEATDNCTNLFYALFDPPGIGGDFTDFRWIVINANNGDTVDVILGGDSLYYPYNDVKRYKIKCEVLRTIEHNGEPATHEVAFKDSLFLPSQTSDLNPWPPTLTFCTDKYAGTVKIIGSSNVSNAVWLGIEGDTVSRAKGSGAYMDTLSGKYAIHLYNSNGICKPDTVTVSVTSTSCTVCSLNNGWEKGYKDADGNFIIDYVKDASDNWYRVVEYRISDGSSQCWLRSNLRTTKSVSEDPLSSDTYYDYTSDKVKNPLWQRGYLYKWTTAQQICPKGWHIPTDDEWTAMEKVVHESTLTNGTVDRGTHAGKLSGGCDWTSSSVANSPGNKNGENWGVSEFAAIPAGYYLASGGKDIAQIARFWTATEGSSNTKAYYRQIRYNKAAVTRNADIEKTVAMSVRCARDLPNLTVLVDSFAGAFKIKDPQYLTKVHWKKKESDGSYHLISTKTSGYVDSLQSGIYSVEIYNSAEDDVPCKTIDSIVLKIVHTTCTVTSYNPDRESVRQNPDNPAEYFLDSIQDASGNWYRVVEYDVTINNITQKQCWMRENLRTEKSTNGKQLSKGNVDCTQGNPSLTTAYYYDFCSAIMPIRQRGYLYNKCARDTVCPSGWKIPSEQEWKNLSNTIAENNTQVIRMAGGYDWLPYDNRDYCPGDFRREVENIRNASAFTIIPAGNMKVDGTLGNWMYQGGNFWTSDGWKIVTFNYNEKDMKSKQTEDEKKRGYSIRCIRAIE